MKLWENGLHAALNENADDFNSSISFDGAMYKQDIEGSIAHATMLCEQGIISNDDSKKIVDTLKNILKEIEEGSLEIDPSAEDIHSFVEFELTKRIGDAGKRLHTARSRNDQVAVDIRLYLREQTDEISRLLDQLLVVICDKAGQYKDTVMPGYTHLQRAQPITFGHHLCAYGMMFLRDRQRLLDCRKRLNVSPLGSCALSGTAFPINRERTAELLGFDEACMNSIDGVSDRDFCIELAADIALIMMHLSRFCEEIIMWCSWEFRFVRLSDAFSTGSSIMPQKKNPDIAELIRGKTGRVYGDLNALLTLLKGIPLAYNKDMQEDKEAIFDSVITVKKCLTVFTPMLESLTALPENMRAAAAKGFINATDCADYLCSKGLPFREAYRITGEIVACCTEKNTTLENLELSEYKRFSELFDDGIFEAVNLEAAVVRRKSKGCASGASVEEQIGYIKNKIKKV